ncbi:MAG TPA: bifunctional diaminohydroxyphosphoribosylaminopyrimidine deaminase/5-amino-6-(5-phosphoribosylamino)uracil reductase RibD [Thermoanaerobaculia bacterium]|nr:bifunctional diaminohydroxyphosphoribosylaminopyrimidine deaminase/5-amino-6-(5-phosphoribosylamino)uracil reductase RibD [Thermoanaerobaculia bacterium]
MNDEDFMRRALALAEHGRYTVSPNPMVGCVIARDGAVIGEGWHRRAGEPHAEIEALRNCSSDPRGATMYVTLEPCCHHGRTGPCANAVIESGVSRVVIATLDPNERVDGRGADLLRAANIEVEVGLLESEARRQNEKFLWSMTQKLPFVLLKAAVTLDGKLATVARESQWITAEAAREKSLALREEYDAILVGSGTVKADNPRLTRRLGLAGDATNWTRVVLDGEGELPPHAQLLTDGARTIVFTSRPEHYAPSANLEVIATEGRADLQHVLHELYARGIHSLLAEGGAVVHSELIRRGVWQKMILFVAPIFVGGPDAPAILGSEGVARLTDAYRVRFDRVEGVGSDLMIVAYPD